MGGLDIVKDLISEGEFDQMLPESSKKINSVEKLKKSIESHNVVLAVQGGAENTEQEEGKQLVTLCKANFKDYVIIDSKQFDENLLAHLKESHLGSPINVAFINSEPISSVEALQKYIEENHQSIQKSKTEQEIIFEQLEAITKRSRIMLFMKGTPDHPQCGFSQRVVDTLNKYSIPYGHFNILSDPLVREKLKDYSKWPTYPQLYVNGKLVGGHDIIMELHNDGDLQDILKED